MENTGAHRHSVHEVEHAAWAALDAAAWFGLVGRAHLTASDTHPRNLCETGTKSKAVVTRDSGDKGDDRGSPIARRLVRLNAKLNDRSHRSLTFCLSLSELVGSDSLHRLV